MKGNYIESTSNILMSSFEFEFCECKFCLTENIIPHSSIEGDGHFLFI